MAEHYRPGQSRYVRVSQGLHCQLPLEAVLSDWTPAPARINMPRVRARLPDRTLTIELDLGPDRGERRFFIDGLSDPVTEPTPLPSARHVQEKLQPLVDLLTGAVQPIADVADHKWLLRQGQILFELLFGEDRAKWQPALNYAFRGAKDPSPTHGSLRLRIRILGSAGTRPVLDPVLWRCLAYNGVFLTRGMTPWAVELAPIQASYAPIRLDLPRPILLIIPRSRNATLPAGHESALSTLAQRAGLPTRAVQVARTRESVRRVVHAVSPELIYFAGQGTSVDGRPGVLLDDREGAPRPVALADLKEDLRMNGAQPKALFLNGVHHGLPPVGRALLPELPIVIRHRSPAWTPELAEMGQLWLSRLLREDEVDPIALAQACADAAAGKGSLEWTRLEVFAHTATVRVERTRAATGHEDETNRLDRTMQREAAAGAVDRLLSNKALRCAALVGYGRPSHGLDELSGQLRDEVKLRQKLRVNLGYLRVNLDLEAEDFALDLRHAVHQALGAVDVAADRLTELLNHAVKATRTARRVLWLDFGVFGQGEHRRLKPAERRKWWSFVVHTLTPACPPDLRIVAELRMCTPKPEELAAKLAVLTAKPDLDANAFFARVLPSLHYPDLGELIDSLKMADCPQALRGRLASLMLDAADGVYSKLMAAMRRGYRDGWQALYESLDGKSSTPAEADDEEDDGC